MRREDGRLCSMMRGETPIPLFLQLMQSMSCTAGSMKSDVILFSHFGHDKSLEIRPYGQLPDGERPIMFYAGDGVSDLSAAKETDLLFAKKGHG